MRPARAQRAHQGELVGQVTLDELDSITDPREVRIVRAAAPDDAEDLVAVVQQQLGEE